jgi:hypothetical protein
MKSVPWCGRIALEITAFPLCKFYLTTAMEPISLPDSLKQQIASYESKLKRMETLLAIAGAVALCS